MKKVCNKCGIEKELGEFDKEKGGKLGVRGQCKGCRKEYREKNKDRIREYSKKYRKQNKDRIAEKWKEYYEQNKEKERDRKKIYREENKDKEAERHKKYYGKNKDRIREYYKKYREGNKDKEVERHKKYYEKNKDKILERHKKNKGQNKDKFLEYQKEYYKRNRDKILERTKEYSKKYCQSERGRLLGRLRTHKRRKKAKENGGNFTPKEWQEAMQFFNNKCAWSGKVLTDENRTIDHIHPNSKGGTLNINNIVPCDRSVNSSKRDNDWEEWYPKQPFYSKEREKKIREWIELKTAISLFD